MKAHKNRKETEDPINKDVIGLDANLDESLLAWWILLQNRSRSGAQKCNNCLITVGCTRTLISHHTYDGQSGFLTEFVILHFKLSVLP